MKKDREKEEFYATLVDIQSMAVKGTSSMCSMGTLKKMPFSLADLHFVPAQIFKIPLNRNEGVHTEVIIGPDAKKPLKVSSPIMLGGMS